jgi:transcription initiation factor IIF auxiliary subunit
LGQSAPALLVVRAKEPYTLQEKGWGAFDLRIIFHFVDNLVAPQLMWFDLNFAQEAYSVSDTLVSEHERFFGCMCCV